MLIKRFVGLNAFVDNKLSLIYLLPVDLFLYIIRHIFNSYTFKICNRSGLFLRLGTTDPYVFSQIFVEREYDSQLIREISPSVVIDLGAYAGYSTFFFSKLYPNALIVAVEANPQNFQLLEATFSKQDRVVVIHAAVHNTDGQYLEIRMGNDGLWGTRAVKIDSETVSRDTITVETISLQKILSRYRLLTNRDMLLKVDIEGGELEVFDTDLSLWEYFEVIAIETHERIRPGCTLTFETVSSHYHSRDFRGDLSFVGSPIS
jgi:FkbM family methyltransferase